MRLMQSMKRSSQSYASLQRTMATKLQPLKKQHLIRGERKFLMRNTTQHSRDLAEAAALYPDDDSDQVEKRIPWRAVNAPVLQQVLPGGAMAFLDGRNPRTSASELLGLSPPDDFSSVRPPGAPKLSSIHIDVRKQAALMRGGRGADSMTEEQAYLLLAKQQLRRQRRLKASSYSAYGGGEEPDQDEEVTRVLEVLGGRGTRGLRKMIDVFRELDADGDGKVRADCLLPCRALPCRALPRLALPCLALPCLACLLPMATARCGHGGWSLCILHPTITYPFTPSPPLRPPRCAGHQGGLRCPAARARCGGI